MIKLIKNAHVFAPEDLGVCDILIAGEKISQIAPKININYDGLQTIDLGGKIATPGLIDRHIHITGGGGEAGFKSRVPEVKLSELVKSGISTVIGLLGTDCVSRSVENLLAKTKGLAEQGMNAFCHTGGYEYPSPSITGSIKKDIAYFSEIIGTKIAICDHRDSAISVNELARLILDTRVGGMIGGKKSFVTAHLGGGDDVLDKVFAVLSSNFINPTMVSPTHIGRSEATFKESIKLNKMGAYVDITAEGNYTDFGTLFEILHGSGANLDRITISSDGNGSWSKYDDDGVLIKIDAAKCDLMIKMIKELVENKICTLSQALSFGTLNAANATGVGVAQLKAGVNADILVLDDKLEVDGLFIKGKEFLKDKKMCVQGMFE